MKTQDRTIRDVIKDLEDIDEVFNEIECECGEEYKNSDPHYMVRYLLKKLKQPEKQEIEIAKIKKIDRSFVMSPTLSSLVYKLDEVIDLVNAQQKSINSLRGK